MKAKLVKESINESKKIINIDENISMTHKASAFDINSYNEKEFIKYIENYYIKLLKKNNYNKQKTHEDITNIINNTITNLNKRFYKKIINADPVFKYSKYIEET